MDASRLPAIESKFSDETRLVLYALRRQATDGPCEPRSRWGMSQPERAKHDTWLNLGKMESFEAMRLFVKLMDEERPRWWEVSPGGSGRTPTRRPSNPDPKLPELPAALAASPRGAWTRPPDTGAPPLPRYQHATVIIDRRAYVVGGSYRGRFMGDVHELDLDTSSWRRVDCVDARGAPAPLSPCAGHRLVTHRGAVYLVGGRFKGDERGKYLTLMRMDIVTGTDPRESSGEPRRFARWTPAETSGPRPSARRGHSATTVGDALVVFGGEDADRKFLGDAHALDLKTMTWRAIEPGPGASADADPDATPAPRAEHVAAAWGDDALLIFGGTGASFKCFAGVHALDVRTGRWERLRPEGPAPGPRAGHAAATVDDRFWCVVGGGNNENAGAADVAALDLDAMEWIDCAKMTSGGGGVAFAAPFVVGEGMSLNAVASEDGERALVAFGGYNGACQRDVQTYRFARVFPDGDGEDENGEDDEENADEKGDGSRERERGTDDANATDDEDDSARDGRSTVDSLAADNLRLRRENARLREEALEASRREAEARARLEHAETRCADLARELRERGERLDRVDAEVEAMSRELDRVLASEREHEALREKVRRLQDEGVISGGENDRDGDEKTTPRRGGWFGL